MRMPPPGQRYAAANWIAMGAALLSVAVGSLALLAVRDALPDRIVVKWDDFEPVATLGLAPTLLVGAVLPVIGCVVVLGLGMAVHRSVRHGLAGVATGLALTVGIGFYAMTMGQVFWDDSFPQLLMFAGLPVGWWFGWRLSRWVREAAPADSPSAASASPDLPPTALLMWSRSVPSPVVVRLAQAATIVVPLTALYWWMGMDTWMIALFLGAATLGRLFAFRRAQLAIDYSGIGLRGKVGNLPAPIHLADVRSAEVTTISALRDFGGWGKVTAPDGRQGWITRSGEALVVHRHDKPDYVYTADDADEAAAVLNTLVARYQSRDQTLTA